VAAPRKKHAQGERVTRGGGLNDKTDNLGSKNERSNKGMKLTSVEHIGRSQLIPGVRRATLGAR
jgi:hypothetical protein